MNKKSTLEPYKKHAQRFGTDGVMETAAEAWNAYELTTEQLVELQSFIDELERKPRRVGNALTKTVNHRLSAEERVNRLLGLEEEEADA